MNLDLSVPPAKRVTRFLLIVVVLLVSLSLLGQMSKYYLGHPQLKGFVPAFYLELESNVPTWYSSFALGLAGALLLTIAVVKRDVRDEYRHHWMALALLFFGLSLDEVAMFHEYPIEFLRETFHAKGMFYYTWVVPGAIFVAAVGCCLLRFLKRLPGQTRRLFLLAGAVFVGGAIGVEMISGIQSDAFGEENLTYMLIITVEESCEMLGVVIFIHALLKYIEETIGGIRVQIGTGSPRRVQQGH